VNLHFLDLAFCFVSTLTCPVALCRQPDGSMSNSNLRPRARILLESSTESEWVARCLEGLGHEVVVADPNFAPMYATRTRKVKTDRRDARTLAEACLLGAYRATHRLSDAQRHVRAASPSATP
jgi:transposase